VIIRFIAIDPSSTDTGWAVFENGNLIAWGTIKTGKLAYAERFSTIIRELDALAARYHFINVAIEETRYAWAGEKNRQRNISGLQAVFRSIQDWAKGKRMPFMAYNVVTWKNNIVGFTHAPKERVKENVCLRIDGLPRDLTEHEYDAIAIGLNHAGHLERLAWLRETPGFTVDNLSDKDRLALTKTGIDALIDEATGYQDKRLPNDLQKRFKKYKDKK
jgi:Holliday junction resolvasome RuvABC endonuclease subunit